jgi:DNA-binding transcriptional LysR family regulator
VLTITTLAGFANVAVCLACIRFRERAPRIDVVVRTSREHMDFRRDAVDPRDPFRTRTGRGLHGELLCREELFPAASRNFFAGGRMPTCWPPSRPIRCCTTPTPDPIQPLGGLARLGRARRLGPRAPVGRVGLQFQ